MESESGPKRYLVARETVYSIWYCGKKENGIFLIWTFNYVISKVYRISWEV